ncbi:MAG: DNA-directed RNA polymerase subunit alpha [Planctomycetes bacterium]|nr:DNA-directed RNA polymerase subunit alpha [Planctomycetota bacterium]
MRIRWRNFELPTQVVKEEATYSDTYGKFIVEPFHRGFGTTIGNGLRRVLLSSIEGTAITWIRIEGADHEFSSLEGVLEDVTDIVLQLKRLRVRYHGEDKTVMRIEKSGPGPILASDIQVDHQTEIANRDLHICTLTGDVSFRCEMELARGRGYSSAEDNVREDLPKGAIPIDSIFSPVYRVKYGIEATRVGKYTNYDRLVLEVWTDGTVTPEMALVEASKIYRKHLTPFVQYYDGRRETPIAMGLRPAEAEKNSEKSSLDRLLDQPVEILGLSVRAKNCLDSDSIRTLRDLVRNTESDLMAIRNFGQTSLIEVQKKLEEHGLGLGMAV